MAFYDITYHRANSWEKKTGLARCGAWDLPRRTALSLTLFDALIVTAAHMLTLMLSRYRVPPFSCWCAMAELRAQTVRYVGRSLSVEHFTQKQTTVDKYCRWTRIIRRALPRHVTSHVLATKTCRIDVFTWISMYLEHILDPRFDLRIIWRLWSVYLVFFT